MAMLSVKNNLRGKIVNLYRLIQNEGIRAAFKRCIGMFRYNFRDRWSFVYFEYLLDLPISSLPIYEPVRVTIATPEDLGRIEVELFPALVGEFEYDRRYFSFLDKKNAKCFLGEKDGRFVHYTWVFVDIFQSPMMDLPFYKDKLRERDAFIGLGFTHPSARGAWIYPYVIKQCLLYLKEQGVARRVLLLVQGRNPAAVQFFKRLGFQEIAEAQPRSLFEFLWRKIKRGKSSITI